MFRKAVILVSVVFFMVLILLAGMMFLKNEQEVYTSDGLSLAIVKPTFFTLEKPEITQNATDVVHKQSISLFGLTLGSYTLVERTLENGVSVLFEEVKNTSWMPYVLSLDAKGMDAKSLKSWNPVPVASVAEEAYRLDPTVNPFGTLTASNNQLLQGNIYVSRTIPLDIGTPVLELRHEIPALTFEEDVLKKNFWLPPKHTAQSWTMISENPFFATEADEDKWIEFATANRNEQLNWLTPAGPFVKLPVTDDPRTQLAYSILPERTKDETSKEWNAASPSVFFETMSLNSKAAENQ
ncbi:hypothetical protein [Planococcus sp. YIM B11945]|uniref:hypothetical protein n=1 Tax=Planococcus sp. YIM B11945 TaxID=3435410 RepID=UPI003D7C8D99